MKLLAMLLFVLAAFMIAAFTLRLWLQAMLSGAPISIFQIIGMRLRKTNANVVVRNLIAAKQAGVSLSCVEETVAVGKVFKRLQSCAFAALCTSIAVGIAKITHANTGRRNLIGGSPPITMDN